MSITPAILTELENLLGKAAVLRDEGDKAPYMREWRGRLVGKSPAVLLPQNTQQVADVVKLAAREGIPLVPQGGNTGLVGAGVPDKTGGALCLSLKRMNRMRSVDAADFSAVAEAGCILQNVQEEAAKVDRLLGITLASEGSASIGGLAATNAGGSFTLRYGTMRAQVLGLEAVLADGSVYAGLKSLHKNNSGYDLKHLLIGSEGTLGIITAATLRLLPRPTQIETAFIALENPRAALEALAALRAETQNALAAFELLPQIAVESAAKFIPHQRPPFSSVYPWIALIETHETGTPRGDVLEGILGMLMEKGVILDAALATSTAHAKAFWQFREAVVEAQKHLGASLKHDLAVPVGRIPDLIAEGAAAVDRLIPGIRPYTFGHVGDGNIHFNLSQPMGMAADDFTARREEVARALHDIALKLGGSISAEHGIGRFKRDEFLRTAQPSELAAMRAIKSALDPKNILNPGAVF